jgi:hypothetical protein
MMMKIISVAGATSKAGKTMLCEQIIRYCAERYHPVFGVKFTTTSDLPSPCPRGAPCTVCDFSGRFRIIRDPAILMQSGKNTARLAAANATEVLWVVAKKSEMPNAYSHLLTHVSENALLVMEGSTVTSLCKPDLLFYVLSNHINPSRWKESAEEIIPRSDFIIRNRRSGTADHPGIPNLPSALTIDLAVTPVTNSSAIRDKIDALIRGFA